MRRWLDIPADDLRAGIWAFLTLGAVLAAHALMETARDALFLASLPPTRLPWVYLAIAAAGLVAINFASRGGVEAIHIAVTQVVAAAVTVLFWLATASHQSWVYYAFYVWSGMLATVVTVQFWVFIDDHYTVTEAKRVFGFVGTGGILGAIVGSLAARGLTSFVPTRHLVLAAAVVMVAAAPLPLVLGKALGGKRVSPSRRRHLGLLDSISRVVTHGYARRLAALVFVSTVTFTLVDFVFKTLVSDAVEPQSMGTFFAGFYAVLNIAALLTQLALVPFILKRIGLGVSLAVLPALLIGGAIAVALGAGLAAALLMKGADGSLRHSLHRTVTEVLYLPMSSRLRDSVKKVIDVVGHRGGQALASLAILAVVTWDGVSAIYFAAAAAIAGGVWLAVAVDIRPHYLDLFRETLDDASVRTRIVFPELDMDSLESLLAKLNSLDDDEVIAAMDVLAVQHKAHLLPDPILFHPSREVVLAALRHFIREGRSSFLPIAERLLESGDPEIRAAALLAHDTLSSRPELLARAAADPDLGVRATALVALVAGGQRDGESAARELWPGLERGGEAAKLAFVRALRQRPSPGLVALLPRLARGSGLEVRRQIARAAGEQRDRRLVGCLVDMLAQRSIRDDARAALVAIGDEALAALERSLDAGATPPMVRQHIPRTISWFPPEKAVPSLLTRLGDGRHDEITRYKCLRGLGRVVADNPEIELDRRRIARLLEAELESAARFLRWQVSAEGLEAGEALVRRLLVELLADKERAALERAFRLVGLLHPREPLEKIYRGLGSKDRRLVASGRELLASFVDRDLWAPLLAFAGEPIAADRLAALGGRYGGAPIAGAALLESLAELGDTPLQCLAVRLAGLADRAAVIAALADPTEPQVARSIARSAPAAPTAAGKGG